MDALGLIFQEGKIVNRDIQKALLYFKNAKNLNSQVSGHQLGFLYEVGEKRLNNLIFIGDILLPHPFQIYKLNFSLILDLDEIEINENNSKSLKSLPNYAIQYYNECLNPPSLYNLAAIYYAGIYVKRDIHLAINLLEKSAKYLNFSAFFLYRIFSEGVDNIVLKNLKKAEYYLKLSGISRISEDLSIDVLKNSRFSYQMIHHKDLIKKNNKIYTENINSDFYDGFLIPKIFDSELNNLYERYY